MTAGAELVGWLQDEELERKGVLVAELAEVAGVVDTHKMERDLSCRHGWPED